jgi:hypothetical protein
VDGATARDWLNSVAPWAAICVTLWVATRVQAVHKLVNSEMDSFRATLKRLAEANEATVFRAGQQDVREALRGTTLAAAHATEGAATATSDAARATTAAAEAVAAVAPPGPMA